MFKDLKNSDINSETLIRKVHRAHEALSQSDGSAASSVKTLSASFGTKWPYKRTMSAPASIVTRHESKGNLLFLSGQINRIALNISTIIFFL